MLKGDHPDEKSNELTGANLFRPPLIDDGRESGSDESKSKINGGHTFLDPSFEDVSITEKTTLNKNHDQEKQHVVLSSTDSDNTFNVDISDALSEREKVKYTVHTKTNCPKFLKKEVSVVREHDEFIWLHNCLEENESYAGFIIPPAPPKPDFDVSREKLQKLGEGEATLTREEFQKMKQELEQEYLATFKKTVALHEVFLCRLASHTVFKNDPNFHIFLEFEDNLSVRGKNKKELVGSFFKRFQQSADEVLLSGQKDIDNFFEHEKNYLCEYHIHVKEAADKSEKICRRQKDVADSYSKICLALDKLGHFETLNGDKNFGKFIARVVDCLEKLKKTETRAGTDEELKETDVLKYFTRETQAGKDLLYRRTRCLANYETANKNLERSRVRNRDIQKAETEQAEACKRFEDISALAKTELNVLKKNRVDCFSKNFVELVELQTKQSRSKVLILQQALKAIKELDENETGTQH